MYMRTLDRLVERLGSGQKYRFVEALLAAKLLLGMRLHSAVFLR
ncbi:Uncharacterised protein [Mycobacteroides abscessus subsp. abscessus]|nr:Uncharacterised protein [Mycobacteroides abscessus subsp. abscessus]